MLTAAELRAMMVWEVGQATLRAVRQERARLAEEERARFERALTKDKRTVRGWWAWLFGPVVRVWFGRTRS